MSAVPIIIATSAAQIAASSALGASNASSHAAVNAPLPESLLLGFLVLAGLLLFFTVVLIVDAVVDAVRGWFL